MYTIANKDISRNKNNTKYYKKIFNVSTYKQTITIAISSLSCELISYQQ